jgi:hypothetical protein
MIEGQKILETAISRSSSAAMLNWHIVPPLLKVNLSQPKWIVRRESQMQNFP